MNSLQLEILKIIQAMFNATPGAQYLNEFTVFVESVNGSVKQLTNSLVESDLFKKSMYADTLTNKEFSAQFVDNIVGGLVNAENRAWAVSTIEAMLAEGQSRGDVIHWAAITLATVDSSDIGWGAAALQFNNKVNVASFYSIDKKGLATDLSVLQAVTANVTNTTGSVTAATKLLESGVSGKVIVGGYVSGATIFADLNGDGLLNENEESTITDKFGQFFLAGSTGFGNLIAIGGTDIATGKPIEGFMLAPAGSSVVSPLTTLISKLAENSSLSVNDATITVLRTLALNKNVDLLNFDPIKESIRTNTDAITTGIALEAQAVTVQVNILISLTASLLNGAGIAADENTAINSTYKAIAKSIVDANAPVSFDFTLGSDIAQLIQNSAIEAGAVDTQLTKVGFLTADVSRAIANLNREIDEVLINRNDAVLALNKIMAIQIVADDVEVGIEVGAHNGDVRNAAAITEGMAFARAIAVARTIVKDVDGDGSSNAIITAPAFAVTETSGTVKFSGSASGNISIDWAGVAGNSVATFARDGIIATTKPDFSGTATKITLALDQTLVGTAANLSGLIIDGAGNVILVGVSTISDLSTIDFSAVTGVVSYSIKDSISAIVSVPAPVLSRATDITAIDAATILQAAIIEAATNNGVNIYDISDTVNDGVKRYQMARQMGTS